MIYDPLCSYSMQIYQQTGYSTTDVFICAVLCCVVSLISTRLSGEEAKMSLLHACTEIPAQRAYSVDSTQQTTHI